jgi:hypothetical protein
MNDLKILMEKIEKPFLNNKIITEEEDRILFPYLSQILGLS